MTTVKVPPSSVAIGTSSAALCRLIGLACLAGFLVDGLALGFPVRPGALEWRASFLQQMGDRSIILLFGLGLLTYGLMEFRAWRKRLAMVCLALGVAFQLSAVLVIRDSSALQKQALARINNQTSELESRIEQASNNPEIAAQLSPEQLTSALEQLSTQSETLQKNAKTGILRAGLASVGNLVIVGLTLLGLGRYGMRSSRTR